ncbi:hypothetical protein GCM10009559_80530 [Pseudonocardia zijingensis]|uniref:Uncharacterized protein n=1 Tax=Pseudonocardia zijingensis TaxID=153376 RepID=A0ABN1NKA2_9PSEU
MLRDRVLGVDLLLDRHDLLADEIAHGGQHISEVGGVHGRDATAGTGTASRQRTSATRKPSYRPPRTTLSTTIMISLCGAGWGAPYPERGGAPAGGRREGGREYAA